jgi:fimbrial chaperone protein
MRKSSYFGTAALALLLNLTAAEAFQFTPIAQTMRPTGKGQTAEFRLINDGNDPIAVEVKIMKRVMTSTGEDELTDVTDEFSLFPAQAIITGNDAKLVRVQWLGGPDLTQENAYRIIAEQVPVNLENKTKGTGAQIQVMLKYVGSLYVQPEGAKSNLVIMGAKTSSDKNNGKVLQLTVANKGIRHTVVKDPVLVVGNVELKAEDLKGFVDTNILVGTERTYAIPYPAKLSGAGNLSPDTMRLTYRESD